MWIGKYQHRASIYGAYTLYPIYRMCVWINIKDDYYVLAGDDDDTHIIYKL